MIFPVRLVWLGSQHMIQSLQQPTWNLEQSLCPMTSSYESRILIILKRLLSLPECWLSNHNFKRGWTVNSQGRCKALYMREGCTGNVLELKSDTFRSRQTQKFSHDVLNVIFLNNNIATTPQKTTSQLWPKVCHNNLPESPAIIWSHSVWTLSNWSLCPEVFQEREPYTRIQFTIS